MLTKDLLEVEKRRPTVRPRYREVEEYRSVAERVVGAYEPGKTRGAIEAALADEETHDTFKLIRGLAKLLERRCEFERRSPVDPATLREAVFERGPVTDGDERRRVLEAVGSAFDLSPTAVEDHLWADREPNEVLASVPEVDPATLLREYNLSSTQTLLFDAVELEFTVSNNYQEIFGLLTYLGLMYTVDEDLAVTVTGPAAVFEKTRKYGTTLAKLVPSIVAADDWRIAAQVETEVGDETRIYEFTVDDGRSELFPDRSAETSFDSEVERDFATRLAPLADGWTITREPTILRTGEAVMIPDFSFERGDATVYLEVIGFWTPEYLEEKLAKVRRVESEHPIVLAVDESLNCTEADFDDANVDAVFFYDDRIPVKPVLERLDAIEDRAVERDLERLAEREPDVATDRIVDLETLAAANDVEPAAIEEYVRERYDGALSNGKFVPEAMLDDLEAEIDALADPTLADVNEVLDGYGLAQGILEELGYSVNYVSLDQDEATITKR